ncbi:hypothetical protein [Saccharicrinis carchari]|nr:hypothetical protein [Saccharicrinis carchari]
MKKNLTLLILNSVTLVFALVMNYLSGTTVFGSKNVGEISDMLPNLFTPAGYAFAIWGLIYLMLVAFVINLWVSWYREKENTTLLQIGFLFSLANMANGFWVFAWLNLYIGFSVVLMLVILGSLIALTFRLQLETGDTPKRIIALVWWPITIYLGWIIVATVANITALLVSLGWNGGSFEPLTWTIVMIVIATLIYLLLIYLRNMPETALVGIWALIAIAVKQWSQQPGIVWAALIASAVLFIVIVMRAITRFKK